MAATTAMQTNRKLPFRYNTRQRVRLVGQQPFVAGQTLVFEMPRVGFVAGILVQLSGGLIRTAGDTGLFSDRMYNFIRRFTIDLNIGAASIYNCSGYGTYLLNSTEKMSYRPDMGGTAIAPTALVSDNAALTQDPGVFQGQSTVPNPAFPAADGLVMTWWLPVSANLGRNFNIGLINLQAPEVRCALTLQLGTLTDLFAAASVIAGTSFTGTITVTYMFWEVPNPGKVAFPPLMYHRVLEDRTPFSNTGDVTYLVPRQGTVLRLIHNAIINNANSSRITQLTIRVNKTDDIYQMSGFGANHFFTRFAYGGKVPTGTFIHDLWNAEDVPASGDFRDAMDSEAVSTLESILTVDPGVILGVGNNFIDTQREIVQVLQV
jgi:hypothetical protein